MSTYLIMAGGTGGHIFPALAVAKELQLRGATVYWLGTANSMEARIIPSENITLHTITIKGFRGKSGLSKLAAPFLLCRAIVQAMGIIRQLKPAVVIGFGGFVAAPGGIAARLLGKKLLVHEQNAIAGSTNKLLHKLSHISLAAFPNTLNGAIHIGNPVRAGIQQINKQGHTQPHTLKVLVMGGSLGAQAINEIAPSSFALLHNTLADEQGLEVWHQTGKDKQQPVLLAYQNLSIHARVDEFITDVAKAYDWADVLICRAGALTVSEVAVVGIPAIFIPLPSAIDNHQFYNAKWLVDNHAALMIEQGRLNPQVLSDMLQDIYQHREKLKTMNHALNQLALPDAANQTANYCEELSHVS